MNSSQVKPCKRGHISERRKSGNCIQCEKERYAQNPERREYNKQKSAERRKVLKANPDLLGEHREYMRNYARKNRDKLNDQNNVYYSKNKIKIRLQRKGITVTDEILEYIANHTGCCDICDNPPDGKWKELVYDHDHVSGNFRGLLCDSCNRALGLFRDDPKVLANAKIYLDHHKKQL